MNQTVLFVNVIKQLKEFKSYHIENQAHQFITVNGEVTEDNYMSFKGINHPQIPLCHFEIMLHNLPIEMYIQQDQVYMQDDEGDVYQLESDDETYVSLLGSLNHLLGDLEKLIIYAEDMTLTETETEYIFSFSQHEHSSRFFDTAANEIKLHWPTFQFHVLSYTMHANKEGFITSINVEMQGKTSSKDQPVTFALTNRTKINQHNTCPLFTIPAHIIEKADESR